MSQTTQFLKWTKIMNRHFTKEYIRNGNSEIKRHSVTLIIREMPIKAIRYPHIS